MGGLDNFMSLLKKKGWLDLLDPFSEGAQDIQNSLLSISKSGTITLYIFHKLQGNFHFASYPL